MSDPPNSEIREFFPEILYLSGLLLGISAVSLFTVGNPGDLSPVTKIAVLLILSILFLTASFRLEDTPEIIWQILGLYSYLATFYYI